MDIASTSFGQLIQVIIFKNDLENILGIAPLFTLRPAKIEIDQFKQLALLGGIKLFSRTLKSYQTLCG
jgi:hypothetical protein